MKLFFIIAIMAISFVIRPQDFLIEEAHAISSIQNSGCGHTELISNNFRNCEIYSSQQEGVLNFSGNTPQVVTINFEDNFYIKNNTVVNGSFIHNLSTNLEKEIQTRAP